MTGLDAHRLLEVTNGALVIDRELVRGWRLYDVHPHEERASLRLELVDDADRIVEIEVHARGERSVVEWRSVSEDAQAASAATARIEEVLRKVPVAAWSSSSAAETIDPAGIALREIETWSDPLLARDFRGYRLLYGCQPHRVRVSARACEAAGDSARYPEPVNGRLYAGALYPFGKRFLRRRRFREYLAKLGFALDANGYARTVPLPETFRAAVTTTTGHAPAWVPRIEPLRLRRTGNEAWAKRAARGEPPTMVPPMPLVRLLSLLPATRPVSPRLAPGMLVHDMSLHAFALHRVRPEVLETIVGWARLPKKSSKVRRRRLYRLAPWFEGSLTRAAWEVWNQIEGRPEAFDARFAKKLSSLARSFEDEVLAS